MPTTIAQKLKIKNGDCLLTINAPADFKKNIGKLPTGAKISDVTKDYQQIHWFVLSRMQLEKEMSKVMKLMKDAVILWIYYPKGSSKLQTDLTRDKGWDCLLAHGDRLTWISLISFDETWSVFGCRPKTETDKKKEAKPKEVREVFKYADSKTKTITLPGDLAPLFRKNKKVSDFFDSLSFTNKREYIEWIVTAKREETRNERLKGTIERLGKGWKNPANR